jgi:methionine--tRNA ligase beta chain
MNISYEDFIKLDIKIGTIMSVEVVADADRLLKLMVDTGEAEPRQIVSGIREFYPDPEVLVGKQSPFLVNLEPRKIKGLESQGMILAGGTDEVFAMLEPSVQVEPGTPVK